MLIYCYDPFEAQGCSAHGDRLTWGCSFCEDGWCEIPIEKCMAAHPAGALALCQLMRRECALK